MKPGPTKEYRAIVWVKELPGERVTGQAKDATEAMTSQNAEDRMGSNTSHAVSILWGLSMVPQASPRNDRGVMHFRSSPMKAGRLTIARPRAAC